MASVNRVAQVLESLKQDIALLRLEVESINQRMKQAERSQATMDMILSLSLDPSLQKSTETGIGTRKIY